MTQHTPDSLICKRCGRIYSPETEGFGICCICFRDVAYQRVFGQNWREIIKAAIAKATQ